MNSQPIMAPAFLLKTYAILGDPSTDEYIRWNAEGDTFSVNNIELFQRDVLGKHFNHSNFCSFVRQLNLYGFHKLGGDTSNNSFCFGGQPLFHRDAPHLLSEIKRRPTSKTKRKNSLLDTVEPKRDRAASVTDDPPQHAADPSAPPSSADLLPPLLIKEEETAGGQAFVNPLALPSIDVAALPLERLLQLLQQFQSELQTLSSTLSRTQEENSLLKKQLSAYQGAAPVRDDDDDGLAPSPPQADAAQAMPHNPFIHAPANEQPPVSPLTVSNDELPWQTYVTSPPHHASPNPSAYPLMSFDSFPDDAFSQMFHDSVSLIMND